MIRAKILFLCFCIFLLTSCHSEYISLMFRVHHGASWNADSSMMAFVASKAAYRKASGISRFPDGGQAKFLMEDVSLYIYDTKGNDLQQLVSFNDLIDLTGPWRSNWKVKTAMVDTAVYYQINPISDWSWYMNNTNTARDSIAITQLKQKYDQIYRYDLFSGKTNQREIEEWDKLGIEERKASLTLIHKLLDDLAVKDLGLDIMQIYPKPEQDYIREIIYLKNDSPLARRAVIEQIISKLEKHEIEELLEEMDRYMNQLEGYEKTHYRVHSEETREEIRALL